MQSTISNFKLNANHLYESGHCYEYGINVPKNIKTAVGYYQQAATLGNPKAQTRLGDLYLEGVEIEKNLTLALTYYKFAAERSFAEAQYKLGYFYDNGYAGNKGINEAYFWYCKAAAQKNEKSIEALQSQIFILKHFIEKLEQEKENYDTILLLDPIPEPQPQTGYNCGHYTASTALSPLGLDCRACKKDNPNNTAYPSLRSIGKKLFGTQPGARIGSLFDTAYFKQVMNQIGGDAITVEFDTYELFTLCLKEFLQKNIPIILPVDAEEKLPEEGSIISQSGGKFAHYITILGMIKARQAPVQCLITTWNKYYILPAEDLYNSCKNLVLTPANTFIKTKEEGWEEQNIATAKQPIIEAYHHPDIYLGGLNSKLVVVFPESARADVNSAYLAINQKSNIIEFAKLDDNNKKRSLYPATTERTLEPPFKKQKVKRQLKF